MNIKNVHSAGSRTQCEEDYSINRECILTELPSISISRLFPHDWMHLCLENHGKNLVSFWKGMYKGMDEGWEEYWILDHVWAVIGKETAAASNTMKNSEHLYRGSCLHSRRLVILAYPPRSSGSQRTLSMPKVLQTFYEVQYDPQMNPSILIY